MKLYDWLDAWAERNEVLFFLLIWSLPFVALAGLMGWSLFRRGLL